MTQQTMLPTLIIQQKIYVIRGAQVMLDSDLAEMYGMETRALKQAVRRNINRFPSDFMFQLTKEEYDSLRSQIVTLKKGRGQHSKYLPYVFTDQNDINEDTRMQLELINQALAELQAAKQQNDKPRPHRLQALLTINH